MRKLTKRPEVFCRIVEAEFSIGCAKDAYHLGDEREMRKRIREAKSWLKKIRLTK